MLQNSSLKITCLHQPIEIPQVYFTTCSSSSLGISEVYLIYSNMNVFLINLVTVVFNNVLHPCNR